MLKTISSQNWDELMQMIDELKTKGWVSCGGWDVENTHYCQLVKVSNEE